MIEAQYEPMQHPFGKQYTPQTKWKRILDYAIDYLKKYEFDREAIFTSRYLYYRMTNLDVMPLGKKVYESFSKVLTRARKDLINPTYNILREKIIDDTRTFEEEYFYESEFSEKTIVNHLRDTFTFRSRRYPFDTWVEFWTEKDTVLQMYRPIAEKYRLPRVSLHGNINFNIPYDAKIRLQHNYGEYGRPTVILYLGDFNPSGDHRPSLVKTALMDLGIPIQVYKVLVNKEHVEQYDLLPDINKLPEHLEKAKRDPLRQRFEDKHGELYNVDVEAMEIETVRQLLEDAIALVVDIDKLEETKENETVRLPTIVEKISDTEYIVRVS